MTRQMHQVIPEGIKNLFRAVTGYEPEQMTKQYRKELSDSAPEAETKHAQILCIPGTNSKEELAAIYTAADFFINPTHEDNYPTVNLEAAACGTRVITYDVGGAKETVGDRGIIAGDVLRGIE